MSINYATYQQTTLNIDGLLTQTTLPIYIYIERERDSKNNSIDYLNRLGYLKVDYLNYKWTA